MILEPTVPCGLCGAATRMTATKRCDACWELETRIKHNPALARRILLDMGQPRVRRPIRQFMTTSHGAADSRAWGLWSTLFHLERLGASEHDIQRVIELLEGESYTPSDAAFTVRRTR